MNGFTQKLRLIYIELFNEDIDKFTEALIDHQKYKSNNGDNQEKEEESKKQFFLNRKTVLRRWLLKGTSCTPDFQKSFQNYKLSSFQFRGKALFTLEDFRLNNNIEQFEDKIEHYLDNKNRVQIRTDYIYIYTFCEVENKILYYKIVNWKKGDESQTIITVERDRQFYQGTFSFSEENNIFITLSINNITLYFLFHDNNDRSCPYIVGTSMGYLPHDNKVPRSQKVVFAKEKLDEKFFDLQFILNETESISAIENRLNLNFQDVKVTHFVKYANKLKQYFTFFTGLSKEKYKERFYYRLAFKEFYALKRLFQKVSKEESYFIFNHNRAFFELIKTLETIKNTPFYIVMEFKETNLFLDSNYKVQIIKERFLKLSTHGIETTIIFVVETIEAHPSSLTSLIKEMKQHNIEARLVEKKRVVHHVNSLEFSFIHTGDKKDFVLADPLRDSKDVFKLFIDEITMDEYRIDYGRIFTQSISI